MRTHLDLRGFNKVEIRETEAEAMAATRLDPDQPVGTLGRGVDRDDHRRVAGDPAESRRLAAERLLLPTRSGYRRSGYRTPIPACSQHAPNEHMLVAIAREGLMIMTGLFWDLGVVGSAPMRATSAADGRDGDGSCGFG